MKLKPSIYFFVTAIVTTLALQEASAAALFKPPIEVRDDITDEYIHNNKGAIWVDTKTVIWHYAVGTDVVNFARDTLRDAMTDAEKNDPILYSRALTRLIGAHVLQGRWDGNYGDGYPPTSWVGSYDILRLWIESGFQKVRYGQCWVFGALLTTLLRASGLPARTVTNYQSHHDRGLNDAGTAVLRNYDNMAQDDESQWNFHVWSEVIFARPDLGEPIQWNAVDATPQEPSPLDPNEPYQCGPAYVPYVQAGYFPDPDTLFVTAEVNAVKTCPSGDRIPIGVDVATKQPGDLAGYYDFPNPQLITANYKLSSTTASVQQGDNFIPPDYIACKLSGGMRINADNLYPPIGEDFTVTVSNINVDKMAVVMELWSYRGYSLEIIDVFDEVSKVIISEKDYQPYLSASNYLMISAVEYRSGTLIKHDAVLVRPQYRDLQITCSKDFDASVTVKYTNQLSVSMTDVVVSMAGPAENVYKTFQYSEIHAFGTFEETYKPGCGNNNDENAMVSVSLYSKETQSTYGHCFTDCSDA